MTGLIAKYISSEIDTDTGRHEKRKIGREIEIEIDRYREREGEGDRREVCGGVKR